MIRYTIIRLKTKSKVVNLAITSKERCYEELELESLRHSRWYRKLCYFYEIVVYKSPSYLAKLTPSNNVLCNFKNNDNINDFQD